jgi:hypothetical protein
MSLSRPTLECMCRLAALLVSAPHLHTFDRPVASSQHFYWYVVRCSLVRVELKELESRPQLEEHGLHGHAHSCSGRASPASPQISGPFTASATSIVCEFLPPMAASTLMQQSCASKMWKPGL